MPTVSRFYGIIISMNFREHGPPHFHATYGDDEALIGIEPITILRGRLPMRAQRLVLEWAALHQHELSANWRRAMRQEPLARIEPLA